MIIFSLKKFIFKYKIIWFSKLPNQFSAMSFLEYRQCKSVAPALGFFRVPFQTLHIDLKKVSLEILNDFDKSTKYEIKRAMRDNVQFSVNDSHEYFINFYNEFAKSKNREFITQKDLDIFNANLLITSASHSDIVLVMHSYVLDTESEKARLIHSTSQYRSMLSAEDRALVGRANRFLHYTDMIHLKNRGFSIYDFGGIDMDAKDVNKTQISSFKLGFGGITVTESNFISYPLAFFILIPKKIIQLVMRLKL
jgi:lipid II:glycine glycyltransferase (peptidoglycan interpeptide bridge formation enzyme)